MKLWDHYDHNIIFMILSIIFVLYLFFKESKELKDDQKHSEEFRKSLIKDIENMHEIM